MLVLTGRSLPKRRSILSNYRASREQSKHSLFCRGKACLSEGLSFSKDSDKAAIIVRQTLAVTRLKIRLPRAPYARPEPAAPGTREAGYRLLITQGDYLILEHMLIQTVISSVQYRMGQLIFRGADRNKDRTLMAFSR